LDYRYLGDKVWERFTVGAKARFGITARLVDLYRQGPGSRWLMSWNETSWNWNAW